MSLLTLTVVAVVELLARVGRARLVRLVVGGLLPALLGGRAGAAVGHGLDVRAALQGLLEVADVADDVFVALDGERDDGLYQYMLDQV